VIGGIVANVIPALVHFAAGSSVAGVIWLLAVLVVYDAVENYVLTPVLVGKEVGLHALTILVSTFVAGDLLGLFGMLLAIPITAVLKILVQEFVLPELRSQAGLPAESAAK
jgi:predicted PurR-regulated permease PerM